MGKVRSASLAMAASMLALVSAQAVRADITSDKPGAILLYPEIQVGVGGTVDTVVRMTNTNENASILTHCFYINANKHCDGGANAGAICNSDATICSGAKCVAGWSETDFRVRLTPKQPIQWTASTGLADKALPIQFGRCARNPLQACGSDADCNPFPGGPCSPSNTGTRIPPVPETPFQGELRCIAIDETGAPVARNDLKGEGLIETVSPPDVASYNALGIQSTGLSSGEANELILGGVDGEYNGCPNYLILNHFFDEALEPVPNAPAVQITTELVMVPCSADYLRQKPGGAVAQFLIFNEFEQRFSTSKTVNCYDKTQLCRIGTTQCKSSVFNVAVAGTLTGQTRINPINNGKTGLGAGLLGIAIESHGTQSAAFNLHMQGQRTEADQIIVP